MPVPETEHNIGAAYPPQISLRRSNQAKGHCKHCGDPLTLLQRIGRVDFCSSDHGESYRRMRTRQLATLLDQASRPAVPRRQETMLPAVTVAGAAATPRLWSGSGKWARAPLTALAKTGGVTPRRLMDPFGGGKLVVLAGVNAVHRYPELQLVASTAPPANLPGCALLPAPVGMTFLCGERHAA